MQNACIVKLALGATGIFVFSLIQAALATNVAVPQAVSPVGPTAEACPTFSWTGVSKAEGYELAVYAIGPDDEVPDKPALSAWLPSGATSWTPPADTCLEAGGRYGWSIRATGDQGLGDWSEPALIQFAVGPTVAEVQAALATLDRFLVIQDADRSGATPVRGLPQSGRAAQREAHLLRYVAGSEEPRADWPEPGMARSVSRSDTPQSGLKSIKVQAAAVKVAGEIRTVDEAGEPRLWGKGRPETEVFGPGSGLPCLNGDIKFGLSKTPTAWASAADACPAGSWVCDANDLAACNTTRPDFNTDGYTCSGTSFDMPANNHIGWTAGSGSNTLTGTIFRESGSTSTIWTTCNTFPVWCCWR